MIPIKTNNVRVSSPYGNRQYYYQGKLVKDFHIGITDESPYCLGAFSGKMCFYKIVSQEKNEQKF